MLNFRYFFVIILILTMSMGSGLKAKNDNMVYLTLKDGVVAIELLPEIAPNHVARIKELTKEGFYDGIVFHRVIDGFMAQTGDPTGTGTGGSGKKLDAEFSDYPHKRGVVSMARATNPNSADSQFFIVLKDSLFLDGQYTAFGKVITGMEYVDNIKKGVKGSGKVENPDKIIKMSLHKTKENDRSGNIEVINKPK